MSATKICPTCQKAWAPTFRFCPEDGSPLAEAATDPAPSRPKARRSSRLLDLPPVTPPEADAKPAAKPVASPGPTRPMKQPGPPAPAPAVTRDSKTLASTPSARDSKTVASTPAARDLRTAPTVLATPAVSEEVAAEAMRRAATPPKSSTPEPAPEARGKKRRKTGGFSETDWFLAPVDPDAVDLKTGKVTVDPTKYQRNDAIPEATRKRASLRRDDEE